MISRAEELLEIHLSEIPDTVWEREHFFHPDRLWRFDFIEDSLKLAIEIQGGTKWGRSRHSYGEGVENDHEKLAEALRLGWRVLYVTTAAVNDGRAKERVRRIVESLRDGRDASWWVKEMNENAENA